MIKICLLPNYVSILAHTPSNFIANLSSIYFFISNIFKLLISKQKFSKRNYTFKISKTLKQFHISGKNKPIKPAMNGTQNSFSNYQQHNQTNMKLPAPNSYPSMAHFLALCGSRRDEKATSFDEPSNKLQKMLALERGQGPNMSERILEFNKNDFR